MTQFKIFNASAKRYPVVTFEAAAKADDALAVGRLLEDECLRRDLDPALHMIRGWHPRLGWIETGGAR
jgi:hypothetical protein